MTVCIVGGGVIGASVAWHLAVRGCRDVRVLDRAGAPGGGSTSRATGGFRAQFGTAVNIRLSLLAREKLRRFADETGGDAGYVPAGYLWLAASGAELEGLRTALRIQHAEGLTEAVEVSPAEAARLNPAVDVRGLAGGTHCPTDGFIRPMGILEGYLHAAVRLGVRVEWNVEVVGVRRTADGRIAALETSAGVRRADVVVNAAGAWAGALARACGVDVPVTPLRRQVALTAPTDVLPASMPMTIFTGDGFHLRVREGRVLLLWPSAGVPGKPFDTSIDAGWIEAVTRKAHERIPPLRDVAVDRERSWAGLYEMSPDAHAVLGAAPGCPNLYLANGSSGHGVMHAPALGHLLAEIILDGRAASLDVEPLSPERFARGRPNPAPGPL